MIKKIALFAVLGAILVGCAAQEDQTATASDRGTRSGAKYDAAAFLSPTGDDVAFAESSSSPSRDLTGERAQARGASLVIRVSKLDDAEKSVAAAIKDAGGFEETLNSSDLSSPDARLSIVAKVPVEKLDDVIAQVEGMGTRLAKTISMRDLTSQLMAQQEQIRLRQQHQQELQTQKSKKPTKEQLAHDHQLLQAMQTKEAATVARVTYADLALTLRQGAVAAGADQDPNWWQQSYAQSSSAAVGAFRFVATGALWLLFMSPFYLPFVIAGWLVQRSRRKNTSPPSTQMPPAAALS